MRHPSRFPDEIVEFKKSILCFEVGLPEEIGTRIERGSCHSKHRHQILYVILRVDPKEVLKIWEMCVTELCGRANLSENLEVETEQKVGGEVRK
jgi:hypothetical protein